MIYALIASGIGAGLWFFFRTARNDATNTSAE